MRSLANISPMSDMIGLSTVAIQFASKLIDDDLVKEVIPGPDVQTDEQLLGECVYDRIT